MESSTATPPGHDEKRLAELGYKQSLNRAWSGFSNFAISFTIISILAGCFTTYGQAWNNGGPIAISWGWPLISIPILIIGFCLSELVSAYPTAGGIYWFAGRLGGPVWAWFTGWFNLIGLAAVVASVDYACATFLNVVLGLYEVNIFGINFGDEVHILEEVFLLFALILLIHTAVNIFRTHLLSMVNSISVWWHVFGVLAIVLVLVFVPDTHQSVSFVFGHRINNSGFSEGMYWFYVLPLGFLLTQYTITGFDASAHISEETHGAAESAAKGVWKSIFYSALIGWVVLLAITFAVTNVDGANEALGFAPTLLVEALGTGWGKFVLDHLGRRPALLRRSLPDERLAHVLRLLARQRVRAQIVRSPLDGQREESAALRGDGDGVGSPDHHPAGTEGKRRKRPLRLLRGRLDHRHRPLHRLRDPDLPALAEG